MKVLWIHNFDPSVQNSGLFMNEFYSYLLKSSKKNITLSLHYTGDLRKISQYFRYAIKIRKISKEYDIVHVQYGSMLSFISGISLVGIPINKVLSIRGSDWYFMPHNKIINRLHSYTSVYMTRLSLLFYDVILPVSNLLKKELSMHHSNLHVLVSPINFNKFYIKKPLRKNNIKTIIFPSISLNNEIKRYTLLAEAVDFLNKKSYSTKYKIVTATDVPSDNMCDVYNSVDMICLPSVYEGWPNVIKESLACGIPFVSTNISDLPYIATLTNGLCFVVEPNVTALSLKIQQVCNNPLVSSQRKQLRTVIKDICDIEKTSDLLIDIYHELILKNIHK